MVAAGRLIRVTDLCAIDSVNSVIFFLIIVVTLFYRSWMSQQFNEPTLSTTWSHLIERPGIQGSAGVSDTGVVGIIELKRWASENLRSAPGLRFLLLGERDELSLTEFLIKLELWSKLLAEETRRKTR